MHKRALILLLPCMMLVMTMTACPAVFAPDLSRTQFECCTCMRDNRQHRIAGHGREAPSAAVVQSQSRGMLLEFLGAVDKCIQTAVSGSVSRAVPQHAAVTFFAANQKVGC